MLEVLKVIRVRCTICKQVMTFDNEKDIPTGCPHCLDGKRVKTEDEFEKEKRKRLHKGEVGVMRGTYKV
jgi:hypothetical protein